MRDALQPSALVPRGFAVDDATCDAAGLLITVRAVNKTSACPECGSICTRVHLRYRPRLADLPIAGKPVRLVVQARRFAQTNAATPSSTPLDGAHPITEGTVTRRAEPPIGGSVQLGASGA